MAYGYLSMGICPVHLCLNDVATLDSLPKSCFSESCIYSLMYASYVVLKSEITNSNNFIGVGIMLFKFGQLIMEENCFEEIILYILRFCHLFVN